MRHRAAALGDPVFPAKNLLAPRGGALKKITPRVMMHSGTAVYSVVFVCHSQGLWKRKDDLVYLVVFLHPELHLTLSMITEIIGVLTLC